MKLLIFIFFLLPMLCFADTYKVSAYSWEPFIDKSRKDYGISMRLIQEIMSNRGHALKFVDMPWDESLKALEDQRTDILPAVWYTDQRTETMEYSKSYIVNRLVFIKKIDDAFEYTGLESLHGKKVGVIKGYGYDEDLLNDQNIHFHVSDTLDENIRELLAGNIDLTIEGEVAAQAIISAALLKQVAFTKEALNISPLYITCSKSNPKCKRIIREFNSGLSAIKKSGELDAVFKELGLEL